MTTTHATCRACNATIPSDWQYTTICERCTERERIASILAYHGPDEQTHAPVVHWSNPDGN